MGLGKWLGSLFGGAEENGDAAAEVPVSSEASEEYKGFLIEAAPIKEGGQYRTAGYISRADESDQRRRQFIRADNSPDQAQAVTHALGKGRQIIDEQGEKLLEREHL